MSEILPVACPDEGEAGSVWRTDKIKDFQWRARCLGLDDNPLIAELLSNISAQTQELESLWQQQKQPDYHRPWWQDGEYDEQRASQSNDDGLRLFKAQEYGDAFEAFTEAIRLCPTSSIYHCNRSAAALRLKKYEIAAEDAENALQREPKYLKALDRAGKAFLSLDQPERALEYYKRYVDLDSTCSKALEGIRQSELLLEEQASRKKREQQAANAASRPPLPRYSIPFLDECALALLSAEEMLRCNPRLEAAKAARIEALILCGRYQDALTGTEQLLQGAEKLYLQAECTWRMGNLTQAQEYISKAINICPESTKCINLLHFLKELTQKLAWAEELFEQEELNASIEAYSKILNSIDPRPCTGLYYKILKYRARCFAAKRVWLDALQDLNKALDSDPHDAGCLQLRAEVYRSCGRYTESFLDFQLVHKVAPDTPDIAELVENAARLCLAAPNQYTNTFDSENDGKTAPLDVASMGSKEVEALQILGLKGATATLVSIRQAYLKLAAQYHPDKLSTASQEERKIAEDKFKEIKEAYELLLRLLR